jgi:hypothetical protein
LKFPEAPAVTVAETGPVRVTVAPLPEAPSEPEILKVTAKLIPVTFAPVTVTCCDAGENVVLASAGVIV